MKTMNFNILAFITLFSCTALTAPSEKAKVIVSSSKEGKSIKLTFATHPGDGLKINAEGPWKLEIKQVKGAKLNTLELKRDAWKSDISGFQVTGTPESNSKVLEVQYKMTTFVCTTDKSMCYREVVDGKESLKL
jgi:hypothetical protein